MSTDTYGVRIHKIEDTKVQLRIFNIYGDFVGIPASKDFFTRIMSDWSIRYEKSEVSSYLTDYIKNAQDANDTLFSCDFEEYILFMKADEFVESVKILETKNYPGILKHTFYYCRNGKWKDENKLPQILFELTVTDPKWISHWQEGDSWGTTAYDAYYGQRLEESREEWDKYLCVFTDQHINKLSEPQNSKLLEENIWHLIVGLQIDDAYIAWRSAEILERIARQSSLAKLAVPHLIENLFSRNVDVSGYAAEALGEIGHELAIDALLPKLAFLGFERIATIAAIQIGRIAPQNTVCLDALLRILNGAIISYKYQDGINKPLKASEEFKTAAAFALYRITGEEKYLKRWMKGLYSDNEDVNTTVLDCFGTYFGSFEKLPDSIFQAVKPYIKKYLKSKHPCVCNWDTPFWNGLAGN
jgi:hypothetical protein